MSWKRCRREVEEAKGIDRVSHLPDEVLHRILSSLDDTKTAVQTSLLSKRWRYLWKDVRVLSLDQNSFHTGKGYRRFVRNLLSHRSDQATIDKVSFTSSRSRYNRFGLDDQGMDDDSFDMVMDYAGRTAGRLRALSIRHSYVSDYGGMADSIVDHEHHESLEALELTGFIDLDVIYCGFRMLRALTLVDCSDVDLGEVSRSLGTLTTLVLSRDELIFRDDDPFSSFPRLKCLKLLHCRTKSCSSLQSFKVSGLQLFPGKPRFPVCQPGVGSEARIFLLQRSRESGKLGESLSLPSLDRASIDLVYYTTRVLGWTHEVMKLFRGLRNAKSLDLCLKDTSSFAHEGSPFNEMKPKIVNEISQFTRLKTSSIRYPHESTGSTS